MGAFPAKFTRDALRTVDQAPGLDKGDEGASNGDDGEHEGKEASPTRDLVRLGQVKGVNDLAEEPACTRKWRPSVDALGAELDTANAVNVPESGKAAPMHRALRTPGMSQRRRRSGYERKLLKRDGWFLPSVAKPISASSASGDRFAGLIRTGLTTFSTTPSSLGREAVTEVRSEMASVSTGPAADVSSSSSSRMPWLSSASKGASEKISDASIAGDARSVGQAGRTEHLPVLAVGGLERLVVALFEDVPCAHDIDCIGVFDGREAVRNQDDCHAEIALLFGDAHHQECLARGIESRRALVDDEYGRLADAAQNAARAAVISERATGRERDRGGELTEHGRQRAAAADRRRGRRFGHR